MTYLQYGVPLRSRSPHNAQHSPSIFIGRAGASPPSRTNSMIFLYNYIFTYLYPCRTLCPKSSTCFFLLYFNISTPLMLHTFLFSRISIFRYLCKYAMRHGQSIVGHGFFDLEFVRHGFVHHGFVSHRCRYCSTFI